MTCTSLRISNESEVTVYDCHDGTVYPKKPPPVPPKDGQQHTVRELSKPSAHPKAHVEPIGVPIVKKRFQVVHLLATIISLICLVLAITVVAHERV